MNKETSYPAFPLYQPNVRKAKRAMEHEFNSLTLKTAEIEALFCKYWNEDFGHFDYDHLYKMHLDIYIKRVDEIMKRSKPKHIVLNQHYFKEMYEVEPKMIKPCSLCFAFREFLRYKFWWV